MCIERKDIDAMEKRIEDRFEARIQDSHMSVAKILSDNGATLKDFLNRFDAYEKKVENHIIESNEVLTRLSELTPEHIQALKEMAEGFRGIGTMRKLILAFGGVAASITAVIYMIKALK